ncbi:hypothetical protein FNV43_RR14102 [Rhamnella rubrinervis]|uniref:Uncharacterized protein n=1 Tax=Rhamnella rubrinervis TaxID=2594499 RepID=A0A8K0MG09_9ROSA|nr:hypothetical protein FNV43_RR14102 [Rhamnella rubrinervis]
MQENQKKAAQFSPSSQSLVEKQKKDDQEPPNTTTPPKPKKLALIQLIFLIYFQVAGGPYGQESAVGAAGPFFSILGFVIFPILWCIPEALITAELATCFPNNGGFVLWTHEAFGPFWGFLMGSWKFLSGVMNLASFPALCIDYVDPVFPVLSSGLPHFLAIFFSTSIMSLLNLTGPTIVGYASVPLGIVSLIPFIVMSTLAIPKIDPSKWVVMGQKGKRKEWKLFFNTLFWNLNSWDSVSTLAGEVKTPQKTFPKALLISMLFTCSSYLIPLMASTAAISLDLDDWINGYYADVAEEIAGSWLKSWVKFGAFVSSLGLFQAQLSTCSYQLLGMADIGLLPRAFGVRSPWFNTPWVGISISTVMAVSVSCMKIGNIVSMVNFLYSMGMLLEFSSFLWLRLKFPDAERPYKVPMGKPGLVAMCSIPSLFVVYVMCVATASVFVVSIVLTLFGILCYFLMKIFRENKWLDFNNVNGKKLAAEDDHLGYYDEILK